MIVPDFSSEYGIDLHAEFRSMSWARFSDHLKGLLTAETRVQRHFAAIDRERKKQEGVTEHG